MPRIIVFDNVCVCVCESGSGFFMQKKGKQKKSERLKSFPVIFLFPSLTVAPWCFSDTEVDRVSSHVIVSGWVVSKLCFEPRSSTAENTFISVRGQPHLSGNFAALLLLMM